MRSSYVSVCLAVVLLGLVELSVVSARVTHQGQGHRRGPAGTTDNTDTDSKDGDDTDASYWRGRKSRGRSSLMKLKNMFLPRAYDSQATPTPVSVQYALTNLTHNPDITNSCISYFAHLFHTVGQQLNLTHVKMNDKELGRGCRVIRQMGLIPAAAGGHGASSPYPSSGSGSSGNHSSARAHPSKGTTVIEKNVDLIDQLGGLVGMGGDSQSRDDDDDGDDDGDDDDGDKSLMGTIQNLINSKLNGTMYNTD